MIIIRPCIQCGCPYETKLSTSKFCSTKCRMQHHRALKKAEATNETTQIETPTHTEETTQ